MLNADLYARPPPMFEPYPRRRSRRLMRYMFGCGGAIETNARAALEQMVVHVFAVERAALARRTRGVRRTALARQVAMYVAHVNCGLTLTDVGRLFGRDRTTVAHACLHVEIRRDEALFDRALDLLGCAAPVMIRRPDQRPPEA